MKYYNKMLLIITFLLIIQNLQAQKILKEEDRKMIVELIYGMNSDILKVNNNKFKTAVYNPKDFFSKPFSLKEADSCFKLMSKTAKIEIENGRINFKANILNSLNNENLRSSLIEITKSENKLFYGREPLEIINAQGGGNIFGNDFYQITRNYPLNEKQSDSTKINGSLIMKIDFLMGYDSINLTKKEIGKNITIGKNAIEIINILNDLIVLKGNTDNVNLINFVSKNNVAKPLHINDKGFDMEKSLSFSTVTMYKSIYENMAIKKISFEDFDKMMTIDKLNEIQKEEQYRIIKNIAKIGENFILYKPIYKTYYLTVNYIKNKSEISIKPEIALSNREIVISNNDGIDIENIEQYSLNEIEITIPKNKKYSFVKLNSIQKVINDSNLDLTYLNSEIDQNNRDIGFPFSDYLPINNNDAVLKFFIKSNANKKIKFISGNLSYIKKSVENEIVFSLNSNLNQNLMGQNLPFKLMLVDSNAIDENRKKAITKEAKNKNVSVEEILKQNKVITEIFGHQDAISIRENQIFILIEGDKSKIIYLKFINHLGQNIELNRDYDNYVQTDGDLYAFQFKETPKKDWKAVLYYKSNNLIVNEPFKIESK